MSKSKKFLQTRLQFGTTKSPLPTAAINAAGGSSLSIEEKVNRLKIGSKHPSICPTSSCKEKGAKIVCGFVKPDGSSCGLAWCDDCLGQFGLERVSDNKNEGSWACPVCRKLCKCTFCKDSNNMPSSTENSKPSGESKWLQYGLSLSRSLSAPPFSRISLAYSERELWFRLQIREFLYQFGDICQMDPRMIFGLQNVQGDWRIRRLSGVLVWQALKVIGFSSNQGQEGNTVNQNFIGDQTQRLARDIINAWATDFGLTRTAIPNTNERLERAGEMMGLKGMNCSRWQDVAELLAKANYKNLPIPTTTSTKETTDVQMKDIGDSDSNSNSDGGMEEEEMDTSSEGDESDHDVEKFRELRRSPLSTEQELHMVQMTLDLLLMNGKVRQDMVETTTAKNLKIAEDELKNATKAFEAEDLRRKSNRDHLKMRIDQFRAIGDHDMFLTLENELKDLCQSIESNRALMDRKLLDGLAVRLRFSKKRLQRLVTPWDGNEYWLFHDLWTPQQHYDGNRAEKNSKERWWAYGVVMIGKYPFLEDDNEQQQGDKDKAERRWWHLDGIENIQKLDKWLINTLVVERQKGMDWALWDTAEKDIDAFRAQLAWRIDYLRLLERNVYGIGFFSED